MDSGEERLKALGYKQELRRDFTLVSNTAISFSIISTLLGITGEHTLTSLHLRNASVNIKAYRVLDHVAWLGAHVNVTWGWIGSHLKANCG